MNQNVKDLVDEVVSAVRSGHRSFDDIDEVVSAAIDQWQTEDVRKACSDLDDFAWRKRIDIGVLPMVRHELPAKSVENFIDDLRSSFVIAITKVQIHDKLKGSRHGN